MANTTKSKLEAIYVSLNPAQLKRSLDEKIHRLYKVYQEKNNTGEVDPRKKTNTSFGYILYDPTGYYLGFISLCF